MKIEHVEDFLNEHQYDIRKTRNGRWIDQKCTCDVVAFVSDCILQYVDANSMETFDSPSIWRTDYAKKYMEEIFNKPPTDEYAAHDEFNKFFRQPMKMLAASGVLSEKKDGLAIEFRVENKEILEFISTKEINAHKFLCAYITKTLKDSGLYPAFERFFSKQNDDEFSNLKERFIEFSFKNTPINDKKEASRIFTKVLNPLAVQKKSLGTFRGRLSKRIISLSDTFYNQDNFRDLASGKMKNVARSTYDGQLQEKISTKSFSYNVQKSKNRLRKYNDRYNFGKSEVCDKNGLSASAVHMHHIFPEAEYCEISDYVENLIALTATQHLQDAHPNGDTKKVDKDYQYLCLLSKSDAIKKNVFEDFGEPGFYSVELFLDVLCIGLNNDSFLGLDYDDANVFASINEILECCYGY